ncbi:hypothetical protein Q0M94_25095 (plasmid) [Deinococcus radiomollis]|uniref:hypothetical protein n=1 Tax=Deinococcus radiomollis TaxID=468916 RepID=UPI003891F34B
MVHTPILDTETRGLSETLNVSPGTARAMLRLMMARLDTHTLRSLRIETVQLDQQTSAVQHAFDPASLYNTRPGSRFRTILPGMHVSSDPEAPISGPPRVIAGMVLEALSLLLTGQAQILRHDQGAVLTLTSSVGSDSNREVCRLTVSDTLTVTPSSVRSVRTALHVALLTLGAACCGPLFPEVYKAWQAIIESADETGLANLPMSENELQDSGHQVEQKLIHACDVLTNAIEQSTVYITAPSPDVQVTGSDITLDLLSSHEFPWSPAMKTSPAPLPSTRKES